MNTAQISEDQALQMQAEQQQIRGKSGDTILSFCHDFVDNQVRLQLFALAYNLGNFLRRLALPKRVKEWSLRVEVRHKKR